MESVFAGYCFILGLHGKVVSPQQVDAYPSIYPDYTGVTIPATIAPMNFAVTDKDFDKVDVIVKGGKGKDIHVSGKKSLLMKQSGIV